MAISQISQANFSYISKQKKLSNTSAPQNAAKTSSLAPLKKDEITLSTKSDNAKKINLDKTARFKIGCYALLAAGIITQLIADYKRNHLAKHIDFQPAKTIEEAKAFAKKHLKIKEFNLSDLDCANYVNEALSVFNNSSKRHQKLISHVASVERTKAGTIPLFGIVINGSQKGNLNVCEKNIQKTIEDSFNYISAVKDGFLKGDSVDKEIKAIYQKFLNDPNSLTFKEKMNFMLFCDAHTEAPLFDKTSSVFAQYLCAEGSDKYLKTNNYPTTIEEFSKLNIEERRNIVTKILTETDYEYKVHSAGEFAAINHEIGHLMHSRNIGESYRYLADQQQLTFTETLSRAQTDGFSGAVFDNISWYALSSDLEYVAEIYSYLKAGHKFCPEIMKKYFSLGGVLP